jgi:DinB superfamily
MRGYAPGKWSLKQSIQHVNDSERIFSYRLLRIARADQTPLPGFEQDDYVRNSNANQRQWSSLIEEFEAVRAATLALVRSIPGEAWTRVGTSSGALGSARMFAYVIAGHVVHHAELTSTRYIEPIE